MARRPSVITTRDQATHIENVKPRPDAFNSHSLAKKLCRIHVRIEAPVAPSIALQDESSPLAQEQAGFAVERTYWHRSGSGDAAGSNSATIMSVMTPAPGAAMGLRSAPYE